MASEVELWETPRLGGNREWSATFWKTLWVLLHGNEINSAFFFFVKTQPLWKLMKMQILKKAVFINWWKLNFLKLCLCGDGEKRSGSTKWRKMQTFYSNTLTWSSFYLNVCLRQLLMFFSLLFSAHTCGFTTNTHYKLQRFHEKMFSWRCRGNAWLFWNVAMETGRQTDFPSGLFNASN